MQAINTKEAPQAIGAYSQAIKADKTVYLSGQIGLDPVSMTMVSEKFNEQAVQVLKNLSSVCEASGGSLVNIVKLNVYLADMDDFAKLNEVFESFFVAPYPARAAFEVARLPKDARVEIDAIMVL